jgi:transmembrane sensor
MTDSDQTDSALTALQQEAHAWIRRLMSGEANAADAAALRRWCGQSPAHAAAFSEASQFWQAFGGAGQSLRDEESARENAASSVAGRMPIGRRALIGGALAASAAGIAIARPPLELWPSLSEFRADYRTGAGEQRQIAVANGVSVQMNTRTSLSVGAGGAAAVELIAGEASFRMPDHQSEPFSVMAAGGRSTTVNARFDVRLAGNTACVTCLADEVQVAHRGRTLALKPQQQVTYGENGLGSEVIIDPAVVSAWQQGLIIFHMTPLNEVIEELNRYRPGRIVLFNAKLGRNPVNGRFRIDQPDEALAQIERAFGVRHRTLPGGFVLLT